MQQLEHMLFYLLPPQGCLIMTIMNKKRYKLLGQGSKRQDISRQSTHKKIFKCMWTNGDWIIRPRKGENINFKEKGRVLLWSD